MSDQQIPLHRLLREVLKNYTVFETYCSSTGTYEIEHRGVRINFLDLKGCLKALPPRQKEAIWWFVICDEKQKVAKEYMGISTVTVGQYTDSALLRVAQQLWPEHYQQETK